MPDKILLVDFENIPKLNLDDIPEGVTVPFFFGAAQRTVTREFFRSALRLGDRFVPIDIEGHGRNALDFHIAFYLGEALAKSPKAECVILSRDKGFDPLVRHLTARGFTVRRVTVIAEAFPVTRTTARADTDTERAIQLLGKVDKNKRPRTRKTLIAQIRSYFPKSSSVEIEGLVTHLEKTGKIAQDGARVVYLF